ncbi:MAG: response regulator [bacterium]|nr:response regulator [bacterium]
MSEDSESGTASGQTSYGLPPAQFRSAFPFHMVIGRDGTLLAVGDVLQRICPFLSVGDRFDARMRVLRPMRAALDWHEIEHREESVFRLIVIENDLQLRGQMMPVPDEGHVVFLGTPWFDDTTQLEKIGVTLRDFAVHDSVADYVVLLQSTTRALENSRDLARQLERSRLEMVEAKQAAEEASRAKSAFLAVMSHEIRTPMNGVHGVIDLLLETETSEYQRECLEVIQKSGRNLLTLLNDMLDFSKIEAGKLTLEQAEFSLHEVVRTTGKLFTEVATQKSIGLQAWIDPSLPERIVGDPVRLRQVLSNLIGNAIKFTVRGDVCLIVSAREHVPGKASIEFAINDTGIGIAAEAIGNLFQPFVQEDASTTRRFGGTGLGLSICRLLVQLMGGEIRVDSVQGVGSSFRFHVDFELAEGTAEPRPAPTVYLSRALHKLTALVAECGFRVVDDPAQTVEVALVEDTGDVPSGVPVIEVVEAPRAPLPGEASEVPRTTLCEPVSQGGLVRALIRVMGDPAASGSPRPRREVIGDFGGARVLVAEDNPVNRLVAKRLLEKLGADPVLASNGGKAIAAFEKEDFELILMDVQMPDLDGLETTRILRTTARGRDVPIIALTATAAAEDRRRAAEAGMNGFVTKPVSLRDLEQVLATWIGPRTAAG